MSQAVLAIARPRLPPWSSRTPCARPYSGSINQTTCHGRSRHRPRHEHRKCHAIPAFARRTVVRLRPPRHNRDEIRVEAVLPYDIVPHEFRAAPAGQEPHVTGIRLSIAFYDERTRLWVFDKRRHGRVQPQPPIVGQLLLTVRVFGEQDRRPGPDAERASIARCKGTLAVLLHADIAQVEVAPAV